MLSGLALSSGRRPSFADAGMLTTLGPTFRGLARLKSGPLICPEGFRPLPIISRRDRYPYGAGLVLTDAVAEGKIAP